MKLILINGCDRAGKDELAKLLQTLINNSEIYNLADPLKRIASTTMYRLGIPETGVISILEKMKDEKLESLNNHSPRELWITLAEKAIKPIFGDDVFAKAFVSNVIEDSEDDEDDGGQAEVFIIPDCRFKAELDYFKAYFGSEAITLIHLVNPNQASIASGEGLLVDTDVKTYEIQFVKFDDLPDLVKGIVEEWKGENELL